jgi:hypothetical protein
MNVLKSVNIIYFRTSYGQYLALGIPSVAMTNHELVQTLNETTATTHLYLNR